MVAGSSTLSPAYLGIESKDRMHVLEKTETPPWFRPKLVECLRGYSTGQFFSDLSAGVTVGIVALPLAMAFAIASGVKPEAGLFTAVIAGFLISAFGGSRVQIKVDPDIGPAGC